MTTVTIPVSLQLPIQVTLPPPLSIVIVNDTGNDIARHQKERPAETGPQKQPRKKDRRSLSWTPYFTQAKTGKNLVEKLPARSSSSSGPGKIPEKIHYQRTRRTTPENGSQHKIRSTMRRRKNERRRTSLSCHSASASPEKQLAERTRKAIAFGQSFTSSNPTGRRSAAARGTALTFHSWGYMPDPDTSTPCLYGPRFRVRLTQEESCCNGHPSAPGLVTGQPKASQAPRVRATTPAGWLKPAWLDATVHRTVQLDTVVPPTSQFTRRGF